MMTKNQINRIVIVGLSILGITGTSLLRAQTLSPLVAQTSEPIEDRTTGAKPAAKPTIVLVHGAFADATGFQRVIPILERDGYNVVAVQNPLSSFAADVETTKRLIEAQQGPVVVVGHSYGGAVITEAAAGNVNVKALVYLSAFAPDAGEPIGAFIDKYPAPPLNATLKPDAAGFLYIDRAQLQDVFAKDVSRTETSVMAATQKPLNKSVFTASPSEAAWKTIPSWYVVAQEDRAINPNLERFYAKRMGAKTTEIKSSHVSFISHPAEITRLIEEAASTTVK